MVLGYTSWTILRTRDTSHERTNGRCSHFPLPFFLESRELCGSIGRLRSVFLFVLERLPFIEPNVDTKTFLSDHSRTICESLSVTDHGLALVRNSEPDPDLHGELWSESSTLQRFLL